MITEVEIADAVVAIGQAEAKLAQMQEYQRVNVRRLLDTLEQALTPLLKRLLFEDMMPASYLRALNGISITTINIVPDRAGPIPAIDFALPSEDVIRWRFHSSPTYRKRFEFSHGVMTIHQMSSEDTYLMHELGHLLTLPPERWWNYQDGMGKTSFGSDVVFDFGLKQPKTLQGVQQLCINEIRACAIESVLAERYQMPNRLASAPFSVTLKEFCVRRFGELADDLSLDWLHEQCITAVVTFDDIMERWRYLTTELDHRAEAYRIKNRVPRIRLMD